MCGRKAAAHRPMTLKLLSKSNPLRRALIWGRRIAAVASLLCNDRRVETQYTERKKNFEFHNQF